MVNKQTPLTLENFDNLLNKRLGQRLDKFEEYFDGRIKGAKEELLEKIGHLPTKEEYFKREDKTMGELKALRDEVLFVNAQYKRTNKRVDKIDAHLGISTLEI